jgi:hypothetical protein
MLDARRSFAARDASKADISVIINVIDAMFAAVNSNLATLAFGNTRGKGIIRPETETVTILLCGNNKASYA